VKRILIYGGGAVGLGIAGCLLKSGEQVDIIAREDTVSALHKGGLKRTGIFGEYSAEPISFHSYSSLKALPAPKYDYILICTKSYHSQDAAQDLSRYPNLLGNNTRIILVQNGWGNAEIFALFFPKDRIYNARVITGFCRPQKNQVEITVHADAIHIGSLFNENAADLVALSRSIADGGIPCKMTDEIGKDLWAKMLYNCALNPLGAIFDVPYGVRGVRLYP
jgi:2-dehydropantoate 2-reductase